MIFRLLIAHMAGPPELPRKSKIDGSRAPLWRILGYPPYPQEIDDDSSRLRGNNLKFASRLCCCGMGRANSGPLFPTLPTLDRPEPPKKSPGNVAHRG